MIGIVEQLLSKQDPDRPHTLLTRVLATFCICVAYIVLYGFYGLVGAIVIYLAGVELMGWPTNWMFCSFYLGVLLGCASAFASVRDYWKGFGDGET